MRVNLAGVETGNDPVPAGRYLVKVTDCSEEEAGDKAKHPGSAYIKWELTIQSPEEMTGVIDLDTKESKTVKSQGRKLFVNTSLLPNALFAFKGILESSGHYSKEDLDGDI